MVYYKTQSLESPYLQFVQWTAAMLTTAPPRAASSHDEREMEWLNKHPFSCFRLPFRTLLLWTLLWVLLQNPAPLNSTLGDWAGVHCQVTSQEKWSCFDKVLGQIKLLKEHSPILGKSGWYLISTANQITPLHNSLFLKEHCWLAVMVYVSVWADFFVSHLQPSTVQESVHTPDRQWRNGRNISQNSMKTVSWKFHSSYLRTPEMHISISIQQQQARRAHSCLGRQEKKERESPAHSQTAADKREAKLNTSHKVYIERSYILWDQNTLSAGIHVVGLWRPRSSYYAFCYVMHQQGRKEGFTSSPLFPDM